MANKKNNKANVKVFIIAALVIALIAWWLQPGKTPASKKDFVQPGKEKNISVPVVQVREDSMISLLKSFFSRRGGDGISDILPSGQNFIIHIKRFTSNNIEFYNNPRLLSITDQGFLIKQTPEGGIEVLFRRLSRSGIYYVEVPADVMFRLMKEKI